MDGNVTKAPGRWRLKAGEAGRAVKANLSRAVLDSEDARVLLGASEREWRRWQAQGRVPAAGSRTVRGIHKTRTVVTYAVPSIVQMRNVADKWRAAEPKYRVQGQMPAPDYELLLLQRSLCSALMVSIVGPGMVAVGVQITNLFGRGSVWFLTTAPAALLDRERLLAAAQAGDAAWAAVACSLGDDLSEAAEAARERFVSVIGPWTTRKETLIDETPEGVFRGDASLQSLKQRKTVFVEQASKAFYNMLAGMKSGPVGVDETVTKINAGLSIAFAEATRAWDAILQRHAFVSTTRITDYPAMFPQARAKKRRMIFHSGPTNSGKTHAAMEKLLQAGTGAYLAPLRLMALENYDVMRAAGLLANMVTGEEMVIHEGATHVACTIEMADLHKRVEVAVIDEVQMLTDPDRGWAWTAAVVGVPADVVLMTGPPSALPAVQMACKMTGESLEIVEYTRKTPLEKLKTPISLNSIRDGDAIIAFSRIEVLRLRERLMAKGHKVATIYGGLGPEVRRAECERFRSGQASVLVATDAIGMGLNLPIARVIFSDTNKFDGKSRRSLKASELLQIAGRAGRYGFASMGYFGVLEGVSTKSLDHILKYASYPAAAQKLFVMPPWSLVEAASSFAPDKDLHWLLQFCGNELVSGSAADDLQTTDLCDPLKIASIVRGSALPLREQYRYLGCPINEFVGIRLRSWVKLHGEGRTVRAPASGMSDAPTSDKDLEQCEEQVKLLTAYLWLHIRWPDTYDQAEAAQEERGRLNQLIGGALLDRALRSVCRDCGNTLPRDTRHRICDRCHHATHRDWW